MIVREPAALALSIEIGEVTRIILKDAQQTVHVDVTTKFSRAQLEDVHSGLRTDLDKFRTELALPKQDSIGKVSELLLQLQFRGRSILYSLFKDRTSECQKTISIFKSVCDPLNLRGWTEGSPKPALVTVQLTQGCGIPVEILPLIELRTPNEDSRDLRKIASSLLGFSAVVRREECGTKRSSFSEADLALKAEPLLPIKVFLTRDLGGALEDERYLRNNPSIDLDVAWPPVKMKKNSKFSEDLARHLWRFDETIEGVRRTSSVQICHLSCHCDTKVPNSNQYKIIFYTKTGWGNFREHSVTLESLRDSLMMLRESATGAHRRSLVFMNSCGSAGLRPGSASSFPDLFLGNDLGFVGFIGTETTVSDGFANLFTKYFYTHILSSVPVGHSLHAARWEILTEKNNPLGLIYSLYADPEIQVVKV